ncbi:hypothetical protein [Hymenobacter sp. YC55]|uniref:hypothetical protein n=1 Tax=Hymenobacter sp. YC55 TaxID=3034019 RepID=UPI0023F6E301|nr:hypothetical protein [Hymenobacter sp. YC55]MDF7815384.1 hypothetical protein [Hymenobacter sp. YC55]
MENAQLSQQIEQCQNSPEKLLEAAKTNLNRKDYSGTAATLRALIQCSSDSEPAIEARKLLPSAVLNAKKAESIAEEKKRKAQLNSKNTLRNGFASRRKSERKSMPAGAIPK